MHRRLALALSAGALGVFLLVLFVQPGVRDVLGADAAAEAAFPNQSIGPEDRDPGPRPAPLAQPIPEAAGERLEIPVAESAGARQLAAAELHGTVVRAPDGAPVAGASIHVFPRKGTSDWHREHQAALDAKSLRFARSDPSGKFAVRGLASGLYSALAFSDLGPSAIEAVDLTSERTREIRLELPPEAELRALVRGRVDVPFAGLAIRLEHPGTQRRFETVLDETGHFELRNLPAGPVALAIDLSGWWVELGTLELAPGANYRELELAERLPGHLLVRVAQRGEAMRDIHVVVEVGAARSNPYGAIPGGRLDADGTARIGPLPPGAWHVYLQSADGNWRVRSRNTARVEAVGETVFDMDLRLARGRLQIFDDASGSPLARSRVMIRSLEDGHGKAHWTDGDGGIELVLPEGRFEAARGGGAPPRWGVAQGFQWASRGPMPAALRLEPPKGP
jgi:hypothetical protein